MCAWTPGTEGVDGFVSKAVWEDPRGYAPLVAGQDANPGREGEAASRNEVEMSVGRGKSVPPPRTRGGDGWSEDGDTLYPPSIMIIEKS